MQSLNKYKNKKIFITGGAGIIGKELVQILEHVNASILVGDKKPKPKEFSNKIKYRKGDLNYLQFHEIRKFNPDIIFHLAATYERTLENFDFYENNFFNNVSLSNHLLGMCQKLKKLKTFIFASSYLIYDENLYLKKDTRKKIFIKSLKETDSIDTRNLIGSSKYYHEKELEFFSHKLPNCKFVSARIFRGYGLNSRDVISRWIRLAIKGKKLSVYGENASFDYIFSKDTAQALLSCIKLKDKFNLINIGSGKSIQIKYIIKILKKYFPKLKFSIKNVINLIERSKADIKRINILTKWKPQYSIEEGIKQIIKYEKKNKEK